MYREWEPRPKWQVPASLVLAAAMVAWSMDVRDDWDRESVNRSSPPAVSSTSMAPATTEVPTSIVTTTTPELLGTEITLATGALIRGSGMIFDNKRSSGIDCSATTPQSMRSNVLLLPLDLGDDAVARTPFSDVERVVFLGRELSRSLVSFTLSDGLALVLNDGWLSLLSFEVKPSGNLLATASGKLIRAVPEAELRSQKGFSYQSDFMQLRARINTASRPSEQLELAISCN